MHFSQIRTLVNGARIENVEDVLAVGQKVQVEIAEIDPRSKLSLAVVEDRAAGTARGALAGKYSRALVVRCCAETALSRTNAPPASTRTRVAAGIVRIQH